MPRAIQFVTLGGGGCEARWGGCVSYVRAPPIVGGAESTVPRNPLHLGSHFVWHRGGGWHIDIMVPPNHSAAPPTVEGAEPMVGVNDKNYQNFLIFYRKKYKFHRKI